MTNSCGVTYGGCLQRLAPVCLAALEVKIDKYMWRQGAHKATADSFLVVLLRACFTNQNDAYTFS